MQIDSPIWYLNQECPCCGEVGELELLCCNNCSKIVAVCGEYRTIFRNPSKVSLNNSEPGPSHLLCPFCKSIKGYRPAKDFEILALGFTKSDYH